MKTTNKKTTSENELNYESTINGIDRPTLTTHKDITIANTLKIPSAEEHEHEHISNSSNDKIKPTTKELPHATEHSHTTLTKNPPSHPTTEGRKATTKSFIDLNKPSIDNTIKSSDKWKTITHLPLTTEHNNDHIHDHDHDIKTATISESHNQTRTKYDNVPTTMPITTKSATTEHKHYIVTTQATKLLPISTTSHLASSIDYSIHTGFPDLTTHQPSDVHTIGEKITKLLEKKPTTINSKGSESFTIASLCKQQPVTGETIVSETPDKTNELTEPATDKTTKPTYDLQQNNYIQTHSLWIFVNSKNKNDKNTFVPSQQFDIDQQGQIHFINN